MQMKRLLLPLLAALALPTDVNANWFSGDITIKSDVGSRFIVKKQTISSKGYFEASDYIKLVKNNLKRKMQYSFNNEIKRIEGNLSLYKNDYFRKYPHLDKTYPTWNDLISTLEKDPYMHPADKEFLINFIKKSNIRLKKLKKQRQIETQKYRKDNLTNIFQGKHAEEIRYKVIYEDLNGYKTVDDFTSKVLCLNPKLSSREKNNWNKFRESDVIEKGTSVKKYWIRKAICDKYAKL